MDKLDSILQEYVARGDDTKEKVVGASFVVTNKDGIPSPLSPPDETLAMLTAQRHPLLNLRRPSSP